MVNKVPELKYVHPDLIYLPMLWTDMWYEIPPILEGKPLAFLSFIIRVISPNLWLLPILIGIIAYLFILRKQIQSKKNKQKNTDEIKQSSDEQSRILRQGTV